MVPVLLSGDTVDAVPMDRAEAEEIKRSVEEKFMHAFEDALREIEARDEAAGDGDSRASNEKTPHIEDTTATDEWRPDSVRWDKQGDYDGWQCRDTLIRKGMSKVEVGRRIESGREALRGRSGEDAWGVKTPSPDTHNADVWYIATGYADTAPTCWVRLEFRDGRVIDIRSRLRPRYYHYGRLGDKLAFRVTFEDLRRSPKWHDPELTEPPLSIRSAVTISRKRLERSVKEPSQWRVTGVECDFFISSRCYIVTWETHGDPRESVGIPVLFSGESGELAAPTRPVER